MDIDSANNDVSNPLSHAIDVVKSTWKTVTPPIKEAEVKGKWYGVIYRGGKSAMLYVARDLMRELFDEDGPVKSLQLEWLMPKIGSGNVLKAPPPHTRHRLPYVD